MNPGCLCAGDVQALRICRVICPVVRELWYIFSFSIIYGGDTVTVLCTRARVYVHRVEFLIAAAARLRDFRPCYNTRYSYSRESNISRTKVFRNYGGKYAAFIQSFAKRFGVLRRRAASSIFPSKENQRLPRKLSYLYWARLYATCTSALRNYLRYYRVISRLE